MKDKYLGDYVDEVFDLVDGLPKAEQAAVLSGVLNLFIRYNPNEFLEWTEKLVNTPKDRRQHPHYDVLMMQRREADDRLVELRRSK